MEAKTAWGVVFTIYIIAGLYPLAASAAWPKQGNLPDHLYKDKADQEYWKQTYPLAIWCVGLVGLISLWEILSGSEVNAFGVFTIASIGAVSLLGISFIFHRLLISEKGSQEPNDVEIRPSKQFISQMGTGDLRMFNFNIWQRVVFGGGALIVAVMIADHWDRYDDKVPAIGIGLGVVLAALAVAPRRTS